MCILLCGVNAAPFDFSFSLSGKFPQSQLSLLLLTCRPLPPCRPFWKHLVNFAIFSEPLCFFPQSLTFFLYLLDRFSGVLNLSSISQPSQNGKSKEKTFTIYKKTLFLLTGPSNSCSLEAAGLLSLPFNKAHINHKSLGYFP